MGEIMAYPEEFINKVKKFAQFSEHKELKKAIEASDGNIGIQLMEIKRNLINLIRNKKEIASKQKHIKNIWSIDSLLEEWEKIYLEDFSSL